MHAALRCLALAGATLVAAQAGSSEVNCFTLVGHSAANPLKTATAKLISTVSIADATTTTVLIETITAIAATETDTTTVEATTTTTKNTVTDTYTSTFTEIDNTETATITSTQTDTTTLTFTETETTTSNSIIATPSGFVPIADTKNGYPARKRVKRNSHSRHCHKPVPKPSTYPTPIVSTYSVSGSLSPSDFPCSLGDGTQYPTSVECSVTTTTQQTVIATETSATTIIPAPVTIVETLTITSTLTEVPRASTTLTITKMATTTTTALETTTTTEIITSTLTETTTSSSYAACQANNILTSYDNAAIVNIYNRGVGAGTVYDYAQADTPEQCCVLCVNKLGCSGTIWRAGNSYCLLMYGDGRTCDAQRNVRAEFVTGSGSSPAFVLSNGLCGYQQFRAGN